MPAARSTSPRSDRSRAISQTSRPPDSPARTNRNLRGAQARHRSWESSVLLRCDCEKILATAAAIVHARKAVAKTYRRHLGTRLINWWFRTLTNLGLGASYRHILTVRGRKTGRPHSTPST